MSAVKEFSDKKGCHDLHQRYLNERFPEASVIRLDEKEKNADFRVVTKEGDIYVECKTDHLAEKTGNIAIELFVNINWVAKPSRVSRDVIMELLASDYPHGVGLRKNEHKNFVVSYLIKTPSGWDWRLYNGDLFRKAVEEVVDACVSGHDTVVRIRQVPGETWHCVFVCIKPEYLKECEV
jgi:hypothetical protein